MDLLQTRGRSDTTTKVFVGSLPPDVTTEDLRKLFEPYGEIAECDIANRCGFLHLEDQKLALKAIEDLNGIDFMGGKISVEKGRVKPRRGGPGSRGGGRGGGPGPMRGGRGDRGAPYARDDYRGGPRGGYGGRDPPPYRGDRPGFDRGPRPGYGGPPDDRRGDSIPRGYDDRRGGNRGYPGERFGGYDRHPPPVYDDRSMPPGPNAIPYDDRRGGYDDRRAPPPPMGDRRMDVPAPRGPATSYDTRGGGDLYSRRDGGPPKMSSGYGDRYGNGPGSYNSAPAPGYSTSPPSNYGNGSAGYGNNYNDRGYGGPPSSYGPPPGSGYGGTPGAAGYGGPGGGYGDSYANMSMGARGGGNVGVGAPSYDAAYPPLPQQRSFSSGGGPGPRRDVPSGRRY